MNLRALWSRNKIRHDAEARRKALVAEDRRKALAALQRAIANRDTRGIHDRFPAARDATCDALRVELGR